MNIVFLVFTLDDMGGTSRAVITQANALSAAGQDVTILSVLRQAEVPHYRVDDRVRRTYLIDVRDEAKPHTVVRGLVRRGDEAALHARESLLVPRRWDRQFTGLVDVAAQQLLPTLAADVVVSVTPGLLANAVQLLPDDVVVVHQEHRSTSDRNEGLEAVRLFAPRADVVALLSPAMESWLRVELGESCPELVVMPNALPVEFAPRSSLDSQVIVAAGRLVAEKQLGQLVAAFAMVADELPDWRLRILGDGPDRLALQRHIRKHRLFDRVELPGRSQDMPGEWGRAAIAALTSRAEGFPLVLQEAMAAGVPMASYDCPTGPREIVRHGVNGLLVSPGSVAGMAAALRQLAGDADLRRRLGDGALASSRAYSPAAIADRWIEVFDRAVRRRRSATGGGLAQKLSALGAAAVIDGGAHAELVTPAEARRRAWDWVVRAARSTGDFWFAVPPHAGRAPGVVLPMSARRDFLNALGAADAPRELCLIDTAGHRWPERRGPLSEEAGRLQRGRTGRLTVAPWPTVDGRPSLAGYGCEVHAEFWETGPDGTLVSPGNEGLVTRVASDVALVSTTVHGVEVPTLPLLAGPVVGDCDFPIDVVYTWVDGTDPSWAAARAERLTGSGSQAHRPEASGAARYTDRDELRNSLRSVFLFAPWVRRIHIVTAGQRPAWLVDHPLINVVDHREILPASALPTFNSHAIETALHRIPDLSEQWIYLNDDVFFGRPVVPQQFFTGAGQPLVFKTERALNVTGHPGQPPYIHAAWNNRALLERTLGVSIVNTIGHTPHPQSSVVLRDLSERFPDDLAATAHSPFRAETDLSVLSSLAQHFGLATGQAVAGRASHTLVNLSLADVGRQLQRLRAREHDFFCLADHHDHALPAARLAELLTNFYADYFPIAAPWERDSSPG